MEVRMRRFGGKSAPCQKTRLISMELAAGPQPQARAQARAQAHAVKNRLE